MLPCKLGQGFGLRTSLAFRLSVLLQGLAMSWQVAVNRVSLLWREHLRLVIPSPHPTPPRLACHLHCLLSCGVCLPQPRAGSRPAQPPHSTFSNVFITDRRAVTVWLIKSAALPSAHADNSGTRKQKSKLLFPSLL